MKHKTNTIKTPQNLWYMGLFLLILTLISLPVHAATIDDAGAERLKTLFSDYISEREEIISKNGRTLEMKGDLLVEKKESYYSIKLPSFHVTDIANKTLNIQNILVNAIPTDNPDNWKMSITIPSPITLTNKQDQTLMQINIGAQRTGGFWDGKLKDFSQFVSAYEKIKIIDNKTNNTVSFDKINGKSKLEETEEDKQSKKSTFSFLNLKIKTPALPNALFIEKGNFSTDTISKTDDTLDSLRKSIIDIAVQQLVQDVTFLGNLENIHITTPPKANTPTQSFGIQQVKFELKSSGDEKTNQSLRLLYKGFKTNILNHRYSVLFPQNFQTTLKLNNIPVKELLEQSLLAPQNTKSETPNTNKKPNMSLLEIASTFPAILEKANSSFQIQNTNFSNKYYNAAIDGIFKANTKSLFGTTGDIKISVDGLKSVIKKLEDRLKNAPPSDARKIKNGIKNLQYIEQNFPKEGQASICNISLTESAEFLINGKTFGEFLMMFSQKTASQ